MPTSFQKLSKLFCLNGTVILQMPVATSFTLKGYYLLIENNLDFNLFTLEYSLLALGKQKYPATDHHFYTGLSLYI